MNLQQMMQHFYHVYGRRNRIFLDSLRGRIDHLNLGICDLQDAIRKGYDQKILGVAFARVVARIFCIAEHFWQMPLAEALCKKYPSTHCSYCQQNPCRCPEKRSESIKAEVSNKQLEWSLQEWQKHWNGLYGKRNLEKGGDNLLNRLFKEIGELSSLQMMIPRKDAQPEEIEWEFAFELADALAWTCALANFFQIDLEQAVLARYGKGCWKCGQTCCQCSNFSAAPIRWENYHENIV